LKKETINIVWFKRDLRFTDNEALFHAHQSELPLLLIYCFEPSVMHYDDSDVRHWRFVFESLQDLQKKLDVIEAKIYIFQSEIKLLFSSILEQYAIKTVFSHQEIGNKITFDRDIAMQDFFQKNNIEWNQFQMHGVIRKLKSRQNWDKRWENVMRGEIKHLKIEDLKIERLEEKIYNRIKGETLSKQITTPNKNFQQGGENLAWRYLDSFVKERYVNYSKHISKPALSRKGCSRLSPYLTYGNISMRMIYQYTNQH
jgi:deoxyribodipyrimidine photo-lyase